MAGSGRLTELSDSVVAAVGPQLPDGPLVVALSGGADSAVCAWAVTRCAPGRARAVTVDHGMAGSARLREAARAIAGRLGLDLGVIPVAVPEGASPEDQARRVRYDALLGALAEDEWLIVGHTADDQAETVMANLLRGAGGEGLAGMRPRRGRIVRPLLSVWRSETRELAGLLGLPYVDDPANVATHRRNALRREVFPDLEERFNPALRSTLVRSAAHLAEDEDHITKAAQRVPVRADGDRFLLPAGLIVTLPRPVAVRAVRRVLRGARGPHAGTAAEIEDVMAVAAGDPSRSVLAGGLVATREGPWLVLGPSRADPLPPAPVSWTLPGRADFGAWHLEAWIEKVPPVAWPLAAWQAVFDAATIAGPLHVRPAGEGGEVAMAGGHKPVAEALAEAGVPAEGRPAWPVVEHEGRVLWLPGVRVAPLGWVTQRTTRYLWVRAGKETG